MSEGDEIEPSTEDNSLGRLLALSDGVFAIGMTLLALDLQLPDLGRHPSAHDLQRELTKQANTYLAFLISFYIVANYWLRHRALMRSVVRYNRPLLEATMPLLLVVAAMPFPAALIGRYASAGPWPLLIYAVFNLAASGSLLRLRRIIRRGNLADAPETVPDRRTTVELTGNMVVFLICVPAAFIPHHYGYYALVLFIVAGRGAAIIVKDPAVVRSRR